MILFKKQIKTTVDGNWKTTRYLSCFFFRYSYSEYYIIPSISIETRPFSCNMYFLGYIFKIGLYDENIMI